MAYDVTPPQLLLGNIPLPAGDKADKAIDRAADEIDSLIGFKYKTPAVATGPNQRAVRLLLQNINTWLASGRLGMELTASTQQLEVHAYFRSLVEQALGILRQIQNGEIILDGVELLNPSTTVAESGPLIANVDSESNVEAFNSRVSNPIANVNASCCPGLICRHWWGAY